MYDKTQAISRVVHGKPYAIIMSSGKLLTNRAVLQWRKLRL
jgi:hypothetical protein